MAKSCATVRRVPQSQLTVTQRTTHHRISTTDAA
jgi:hypothetical protein